MQTHENNTSLNSQWTKETFGYLEIFDFKIFDFCKFLTFYLETWLDLFPI